MKSVVLFVGGGYAPLGAIRYRVRFRLRVRVRSAVSQLDLPSEDRIVGRAQPSRAAKTLTPRRKTLTPPRKTLTPPRSTFPTSDRR